LSQFRWREGEDEKDAPQERYEETEPREMEVDGILVTKVEDRERVTLAVKGRKSQSTARGKREGNENEPVQRVDHRRLPQRSPTEGRRSTVESTLRFRRELLFFDVLNGRDLIARMLLDAHPCRRWLALGGGRGGKGRDRA
jgi:hypothetical protein